MLENNLDPEVAEKPLFCAPNLSRLDPENVRSSRAQSVHLALVNVEAGNCKSLLAIKKCKGQSNVT